MKRKISLSVKLTITMLCLVAGIIILCWILNHTFLETFYIYEKKQTLTETFQILEQASKEGIVGEDSFDITFEKLCANSNLNILLVDAESNVIRSSMWDVKFLLNQVQELLRDRLEGLYGQSEIMESMDNYTIMRQTDMRLKSDYLVFFGNFVIRN